MNRQLVALSRQQYITWTNRDQFYWRIYTSPGPGVNSCFFLIKILLIFVPKVSINKPSLIQIMAWCWTGNKPLCELNVNIVYWCSYASLQPGWVKSISLPLPLVMVVIWLVLSGPVRQPAVLLEKDGRCFLGNIALGIFHAQFKFSGNTFCYRCFLLHQMATNCFHVPHHMCTHMNKILYWLQFGWIKFFLQFEIWLKLFVKWAPGFQISVHHHD